MTEPIILLRDTREDYEPEWSADFQCETATLAFGDYTARSVSQFLAVELKWSLDDYVACCTWERERFDSMLRGLARYAMRAIIVAATEADARAGKYHSQANPKAVLASSYAWAADYGVATIWAGDREKAARLIEWFARRALKKFAVAA